MRVLVCGSRDWAYSGPPVYGPEKPAFDPASPDAHIIVALLDGLYLEHSVGFELITLDPFVVIEGGATGADSVAWWWTTQSPLHPPIGCDPQGASGPDRPSCFEHEHYPANWSLHGRKAGPLRNHQMLDEGKPDLVLAFSHDFESSRGTAHMIRIAEEAGVPVRRIS